VSEQPDPGAVGSLDDAINVVVNSTLHLGQIGIGLDQIRVWLEGLARQYAEVLGEDAATTRLAKERADNCDETQAVVRILGITLSELLERLREMR
jgi:hypothetical protein